MTTDPTPRHIAHAIADLGHARVVQAWRYLDTWAALEAGGMPAQQMRDVMDREPVDTEALRQVQAWANDGARGLVVLHGAQDCGKTYAAAWWMHDRHRRGLATMWISAAKWGRLTFDEIRPMLRRAERAAALVVDDAGCGESQGEHFRRTMEALFIERGDRPTIISGNLNPSQMDKWLGSRVLSRLRVAGIRYHIDETLGMRERDLDKVDAWGRGSAWQRAHKLASIVGCERGTVPEMETVPDDYGGTYERATGRETDRYDVGRELELRVGRSRYKRSSRELLRTAASLAGLDRDAVLARARELVGTASDHDAAKLLGDIAGNLAGAMRADNQRRSDECAEVMRDLLARRPSPAAYETGITARMTAPEWTSGADGRAALKALGFTVKRMWDGWALYLGDSLKACGAESKAAAWECAARLCGPVPKPPPRTVDRERPLPPEGPRQ